MKIKITIMTLATIGLLSLTSSLTFSQKNRETPDAPTTPDFHISQNLGTTVNSGDNDNGVFVAPNGLSLYFSSNRPGGQGQTDIWVAQRQTITSAWGVPQNLGTPINTDGIDNRPRLSPDGRTMFFNSDREGGQGAQDIYISTRTDPTNDLGWTAPLNLGPSINTPETEAGASYFEDPITGSAALYFTSDRPGGLGDLDIYQSTRNPDGTFNAATNSRLLNSPARDLSPQISRDGSEIYLVSNRGGGLGAQDIWVAKRASPSARWPAPVNVTTVNSDNDEADPSLSPDGSVLYFASGRDGGIGLSDLYSATRLCTK